MSGIHSPQVFLISRTDAIGDVMLTLPLAGWLKQHYPGCRILFLGRTYTQAVVACCSDVDAFLNWDELRDLPEGTRVAQLQEFRADVILHVFPNRDIARLASRAGIPHRIGTRSRWFHWFSCNHLVTLSRRHSPQHESQLNMALLQPLGLVQVPDRNQMPEYIHFQARAEMPAGIRELLEPGKRYIILHPKSQGSAREWDLKKFGLLARQLHQLGWQVFVSGTQKEGDLLQPWLQTNRGWITDVTGQLNLNQFIAFIAAADGLVAASTGPLHLAAGLGIHALGLYPPMPPIHPGRWAPLGTKAEFLVLDKDCADCRRDPGACACIRQLSVEAVLSRIGLWEK